MPRRTQCRFADHASKFADIAGPGMFLEDLNDIRTEAGNVERRTACELEEKMMGQSEMSSTRFRNGGS